MSTSVSGGRQNNYVNKQNQPQRNTDAKIELELCRVRDGSKIRWIFSFEKLFMFILYFKKKPVLFAVRTNVSYEPMKDHNAPVPLEMIVNFDTKEYLHIKHVSCVYVSKIFLEFLNS